MSRNLLIFDLDETLIHASTAKLSREPDFEYSPYLVYIRPFAYELIAKLASQYDFAVWSSASKEYVDAVVPHLFGKKHKLVFVWSVDKCVQRVDVRTNSYVYVKDLRKVQGQGYSIEQITMLDDSREKLVRQPRNHVLVRPYHGQEGDEELLALGEVLLERLR